MSIDRYIQIVEKIDRHIQINKKIDRRENHRQTGKDRQVQIDRYKQTGIDRHVQIDKKIDKWVCRHVNKQENRQMGRKTGIDRRE